MTHLFCWKLNVRLFKLESGGCEMQNLKMLQLKYNCNKDLQMIK